MLFGSVFSLHALHPLWIAPLDDPLTILLFPLFGGGVLLTIGLLLSAVEAHWRGDLVGWLTTDAGLIAVYLGLLCGFVWPTGIRDRGRRRRPVLPRSRVARAPTRRRFRARWPNSSSERCRS